MKFKCCLKSGMVVILCLFMTACASKNTFGTKPKTEKFKPQVAFKTIWKASGGQGLGNAQMSLQPAFVYERGEKWVVVPDYVGNVFAINAETGKRVWRQRTKLPLSSGVGHTNNAIVVGSAKGQVIALDKAKGSKLWQSQVSTEVLSSPIGTSEGLVALSIDSKLHGLNAQTGEQMWLYESSAPSLKLRGATNPLLIEDYALVGFANGQVGLFKLDNGAIAWLDAVAVPHGRNEIQRMVDINGRMVRYADTAYIVTYHGKLAAIDLPQHQTLWTKDMSSYVGVAVDDRDVVVTDENDSIYLLDRFTGETKWKQTELKERYLTTPVFYQDYVVVADVYGYAYAFSRQTGEMLGMERIFRAAVRTSPLVDSQGIYLHSHPGRLFKLTIEPIRS